MAYRSFVLVLILAMAGSSLAEWVVSGYCVQGSSSMVRKATVSDGNCTPMEGQYWQLITTNATTDSILIHYCYDNACSKCDVFNVYPITKFKDCATTPDFVYPTKTNPDSAVVAMLGGKVFGTGDTYDNCSTILQKQYNPANLCIPDPASGESMLIDCNAEFQQAWYVLYSDLNCKHAYRRDYIGVVGKGCDSEEKLQKKRFPTHSYNFCNTLGSKQ